jgi:hypothetical protein
MATKRPSVRNLPKKGQRPPGSLPMLGRLRIGLNGFALLGNNFGGVWFFECKDFPEIEKAGSIEDAAAAFFRRANGGKS